MRYRTAVGLCVTMMFAAIPATPQERLGDVAGSVKLNREALEGTVIDQNTVPPAPRSQADLSNGAILQGVIEDGLTQVRTLIGLLEDARQGGLFIDPEWREQIEEAAMRIEIAQQDLRGVWQPGRYESAYELAERAMTLATIAATTVREGIALEKLSITVPLEQLNEGVDLLEETLPLIRLNLRQEQAEAASPLLDSTAAIATSRDACGRKYAAKSEKWTKCIEEQNAAVRSINLRDAVLAGVQETDFNKIRNGCRFEWPNDFVLQNRCEVERLAKFARR